MVGHVPVWVMPVRETSERWVVIMMDFTLLTKVTPYGTVDVSVFESHLAAKGMPTEGEAITQRMLQLAASSELFMAYMARLPTPPPKITGHAPRQLPQGLPERGIRLNSCLHKPAHRSWKEAARI